MKKLLIVLMALAFVFSGCVVEPNRYAGDSRPEAKTAVDNWMLTHLKYPGFWQQKGPAIKSHVLNREAWRYFLVRPDKHQFLCVYVWWDDYLSKDFAVQGGC